MTTTPNMGITYVEVGTGGPTWANTINDNTDIISEHDHSPGKGLTLSLGNVKILGSFELENPIINVSNFSFYNNSSPFSSLKTLCLMTIDGDAYAIDGKARKVKLTSGGSINSTIPGGGGGFSGDFLSASAVVSYTTVGEVYEFFNGSSEYSTLVSPKVDIVDLSTGVDFLQSSTVSAQLASIDFNPPTSVTDSYLRVNTSGDNYVLVNEDDYKVTLETSSGTVNINSVLACFNLREYQQEQTQYVIYGSFYTYYVFNNNSTPVASYQYMRFPKYCENTSYSQSYSPYVQSSVTVPYYSISSEGGGTGKNNYGTGVTRDYIMATNYAHYLPDGSYQGTYNRVFPYDDQQGDFYYESNVVCFYTSYDLSVNDNAIRAGNLASDSNSYMSIPCGGSSGFNMPFAVCIFDHVIG